MVDPNKVINIRISNGSKVVETFTNFGDINGFNKLTQFVIRAFPLDEDSFQLMRKSKKEKGYIDLKTSQDFQCLVRSLKVKDTLDLIIVKGDGNEGEKAKSDNSTSETSTLIEKTTIISPKEGATLSQQLSELDQKINSIGDMLNKVEFTPVSAPEATENTNLIKDEDEKLSIPWINSQYKNQIVKLIRNYDTDEKLAQLTENNKHFIDLLSFVDGDIEKLFKVVEDYHNSQKFSEPSSDNNCIKVKFITDGERLKFTLTNKSKFRTPPHLILVIQVLNTQKKPILSIKKRLGEHSILPNYERIVYFNFAQIDKASFASEGSLKVSLIYKTTGDVFKVGYSKGSNFEDINLYSEDDVDSDNESFKSAQLTNSSGSTILENNTSDITEDTYNNSEIEKKETNLVVFPVTHDINNSAVTLVNNQGTTLSDKVTPTPSQVSPPPQDHDIVTGYGEQSFFDGLGDDYEILSADEF